MSERIDWPGMMRIGLGVLRLSPDVFWSMTPTEFCYALQGAGVLPIGEGRLNRPQLEALMAAYPDHSKPPLSQTISQKESDNE